MTGVQPEVKFPEAYMAQDYAEAAKSFKENLRCIEARGQKNSADWYLVNGLFRLAQGLATEHEAEEDRRRSYARSWNPRK